MPTTKSPAEVQASLDKPGAGIPFFHIVLNRLFIKPFKMRKTSWQECESMFNGVNAKYIKSLQSFRADQITTRVLVPPQVGLEDSSRYWSAAMTARHLVIVGQGMEKIIVTLKHAKTIPLKVDTAKLKPEEERNDPNSIEEYIRFSQNLVERINQAGGDPNSTTKYPHPWFGSMTAKDWLWLMAIHTSIHRKQLENIRNGLSAPG